MKSHGESQRLEAAAASVSRALALATVAAALGFLLVVAGVVAWQPGWAVLGLGGFTVAWVARLWLQHSDEARAERVVSAVLEDVSEVEEARAAELMRLLEAWEEAEGKRGSAEFEPWTLQALRNDIRRVVESDPALEELFERLRRAA